VAALQVFLIVVGVPLLLLSGLLEERHQAAVALRDRLQFERLLSRLTAGFVYQSSDRMNEAFAGALKLVGEGLGLAQVTLRTSAADGDGFDLVYSWPADAASPPPGRVTPGQAWGVDRLVAKGFVAISSSQDLPPEASSTKEVFRRQGIRASLSYPLTAGGRVLGILSFASAAERAWPDPVVQRWRLIADVIASALARKETEDALRAGEAMKSAILASLTSQVAVLARDGLVMTANESWARLMAESEGMPAAGVGADFLEAWRIFARRHAPHHADAARGIEQVLRGRRPSYVLEYGLPERLGGRWFVMTVVPLQSPPEAGAVVSLSEVTDRRHAEATAQSARQELAHFLRVSTIGELTTSIAHQLNQPLAAILANAQAAQKLIETGEGATPEVREILADIVDEDKRAGDVIARLRELLRKGATERSPLEINAVVGEVARLLESDVLIRRARLRFEPHPRPLVVLGDRVQVQQVILNLVVNALEALGERPATGNGASVVLVRTEGTADGQARISVEDSGPGLSEDLLQRIFEPFFTTKSTGMGMGLSIARTIVETHGGSVSAANAPAGGAVFAVLLPLARGSVLA
jgi:C4-dicarboxylate-specific signal transduction histidine kinase